MDSLYDGIKCITQGKTTYISREDGIKFVNRLMEHKIIISGLDGVYITSNSTLSPIDLIYDFGNFGSNLSKLDAVIEGCKLAKESINDLPLSDDLFIDFSLTID